MKHYFSFIQKYLFHYKKDLTLIIIVTILQSIIIACIPLTNSTIVDKGIGSANKKILMIASLSMLFLYLANSLITILNNYLMARIGEKIGYVLRKSLNSKICKLEYAFFLRNTASNIISSFNKEIDAIKSNISYMLLRVLGNVISLMISLCMIFLLNWKIGFLTLCTSIFYAISIKGWGMIIKPLAEKSYYYNEKIINILLNTYKNVLVVKMNNAYGYIQKRFDTEYSSFYDNEVKLETAYTANINLGMLIMSMTTVVMWYFGGIKTIDDSFTIGNLIAIIGYQNMLVNPINFICDFSNSYLNANKAIKNLEEILGCQEECSEEKNVCLGINSITLDHVFYKYDSNILLEDVCMHLKKGEIYGIIGESGAGKSTIAKMIVRLLDPSSGKIYINSISSECINLYTLREKIGYIMQDTLFFNDTILNNIFLDQRENLETLCAYSQDLEIYDEIMDFPLQWETVLCEDSQNISGGQKKRIDILRSIVKNVNVLIFDESFSGIDIHKRSEIHSFIRQIKEKYIILIISHDPKDIEFCDTVFKIENKKMSKSN